ncbi:cytochrome c biogenesis protein ResB [Demequina sp. NBRC 110057]|uniref:cytochrome c biogenesis protein ResB n=1 Tax=Demequina sp. NBRC 110057 TaxID=1570346 RepID=UPI001F417E76|nr:cytochrome c biogenesis protein ResB [Demequina sp. NBRC 110057]
MKIDNYAYRDMPRLGLRGWLRWIWRQVTSMRVALILLLILALAAIPGSVLPQWPHSVSDTQAFIDEHEFWGPLLDRLGFLDVFGSAWFTAIYLLLFASLIGCIIPRVAVYWRELRAEVPAAPSRLDRYAPVTETSPLSPADAVAAARSELTGRGPAPWRWLTGHRVRVDERTGPDGAPQLALSAHRGHLRELGNLVFHLSLVGILLSVAAGSLLTYRGQALIVEGGSFTNAVVAYDTYSAGALFSEDDLDPWILTLDELDAQFEESTGRPTSFTAYATLTEPGQEPREVEAQVNRPIQVEGAKIYLQGNGYAPSFTITDSEGNVAFEGAVPFIPQDDVYTSTGVVKVPDVTEGEQMGFKGTLLPSALGEGADAISIFPDAENPVMYLQMYTGDLGLDEGVPQNVYTLDESQLSPVRDEDDEPVVLELTPGETVELPDGMGTLTWNDLPRYAAFDLRRDPSLPWLLGFAVTSLLGLGTSLFAPRRRVWVTAPTADAADAAATVVTVAVWSPPHDQGATLERDRALAAACDRPRPASIPPEDDE